MDQVEGAHHGEIDGRRRSPPLVAHDFFQPRSWSARLGIVATATFIILLGQAIAFDPEATDSFDLSLIQEVQRIRWEPLGRWLNYFEQLTDAPGAIRAWMVMIAVFALLRWWLPALALLSLPLGGLINEAIARGIVGRYRPQMDILRHRSENPEAGSFPSGHVVGAVLLYGFIWYVAGRRVRFAPFRWLIQVVCLGIILLTGFDRVWDGAHWPTDVLGGYALGLALLLGLILMCEWVERIAANVAIQTGGQIPIGDRDTFEEVRQGSWATALLRVILVRHYWLAVRLSTPSPKSKG